METEEVVRTPPAESSPAPDPQTPPAESSSAAEAREDIEAAEFETLSDAQRSEWLQTGKTPTKPAARVTDGEPPKDGSQPPAPKASAPKGEKPASGPGKNKGEEVRVHQLLQDRHKDRVRIQELEAQLAGKNGAPPAGTPPAAEKKSAAAEAKAPVAPKLDDFQTWGEFVEAQNQHFEKLADFKAAEAVKADRAQRERETQDQTVAKQNEAIEKSWKTRVTAALEKHADFKDVALSSALGAIIPQGSVIDAYVLESEYGAEILYALGSDLGEAERLAGLTPVKQAIELGRLEAQLTGTPAKKPAEGVKHVSSASPPARELGNPKANVADPVDAALEGKDFEAYQAEMNACDMKARTGK